MLLPNVIACTESGVNAWLVDDCRAGHGLNPINRTELGSTPGACGGQLTNNKRSLAPYGR